jgi:hypothetical protein
MNAPARAEATSTRIAAVGTPPGFDALAVSRETLVDIYFGDRKVGEALAEIQPGLLQFKSPADVLAAVPSVIATPELNLLVAGELPTNSSALCSLSRTKDCGVLAPAVLGIIYDEERFRVDLFVNPRFLRTAGGSRGEFLPVPSAALSLTSALGVAAAGAVGGRTVYNVQNRTVAAFRNARIRTSNSVASGLGWVVDDFAGEVDSKDLRYSAGMFWAPGSDLIGQRRIIGAGVGTQFDTRADPGAIRGTPLVTFLAQPARVELLVDGRLVSSRSYEAGNQELDTSALPDGSYSVLLRVEEQNGSVREEQRFFVKNAAVPPVHHPVYFAYAGLLANTRAHRPVDPSSTLFYQAGTARRLSNSLAIDAEVLGTQRKAMLEIGGWLMGPPARIRVAALGSTSGDVGLLLQLSSNPERLLNVSFDVRRIWSGDGASLIPLPGYVGTFDPDRPVGAQLATGSYTQAVGSIGLRLGAGNLSLLGSYRRDSRLRSDYSIGPSLNWPVVTRNRLQVTLELSGQRTRGATAAFAGVRILSTAGPLSVVATAGRSVEDHRSGSDDQASRSTGSVSVQYSGESGGALLTADAGAERDLHSSSLHAGGTLSSRLGDARADILHGLEGRSGTQYDLSFQSGLAISAHSAHLGARQSEPSAIVISVHGDANGARFKVLVDDRPSGEVRMGQHLSLFVPGYRTYRVRVVSVDAAAIDYDPSAREVTLYPGNVQPLEWQARSYVTVVGQAVSIDGSPIVNALVQTEKGVAETDSKGFFQLDVRGGDAVSIARDGASPCQVALPKLTVHNDLASVGKVTCQ